MSWAKLDDRANEHRKQLAAGAEACWLWACGLMYANRQDARDGFIPDEMLSLLYPFRGVKKLASRLVSVGLWVRTERGFLIHEFTEWNKSREQVEQEREATRARVAKHRKCNAVTPADVTDPCNGVGTGSSASASASATPDLPRGGAREDPLLDSLVSPADLLPDGWLPNAENRELASRIDLDIDEELGLYRAQRKRDGFMCGNWDADFECWLRRSKKFERERAAKRQQATGLYGVAGESRAERQTRIQIERVARLEEEERKAATT